MFEAILVTAALLPPSENVVISDSKPYILIYPTRQTIFTGTFAILSGKRIFLKIDRAKIRSCKNNVKGIRIKYNDKLIADVLFKDFKFGYSKTSNFNIDITDNIINLPKKTGEVKLDVIPIFEGDDKDGCFSFTAKKMELLIKGEDDDDD